MAQALEKRSVGRPREFDEDAALEAVMEAFWRKGYEATSLTDLCDCTGLHKGSLYQAFGGKHELFMRALKQYSDRSFADVASAISTSNSPLENIRAVMHKVMATVEEDCGCFMINSLVELAPHDPEVMAFLDIGRQRRLEAMTGLVAAAQAAGEIKSSLEPQRIALQIMVTLAGLAATMKGFLTKDQAQQTIEDTIAALT